MYSRAILFLLPAFFALALISGCAQTGAMQEDETLLLRRYLQQEQMTSSQENATRKVRTDTREPVVGQEQSFEPRDLPSKEPGRKSGLVNLSTADEQKSDKPSGRKIGAEGQAVLNFDQADIREVARQVFGEQLNESYVIDPGVQGQISLYFEGEFSKEELLNIVTYAFRTSGMDVVLEDGVYVIRPLQRSNTDLEMADSLLLKQDEKGVSPFIVVYRPRFIKAEQAKGLITHFITPGRLATTDPLTNSVIFIENRGNARKVLGLLRALDMNVLDEVGMEIVELEVLDPKDAVNSMESIISSLGVFKNTNIHENLVFMPLEHFNGVLILAQDESMLATAREWLRALDIQGVEAGDQIFVYNVENGLAANIASILQELFAGGEDRADSPRVEAEKTQHIVEAEQGGGAPPKKVRAAAGAVSTDVSGRVLIIPDEVNNSIVIKAGADDLVKVKETIRALDVMPRAVLIEVVIAEVRLTDDLTYGVEWFLRNRNVTIGGTEYDYTVGSGASSGSVNIGFDPDFQVGSLIPQGLSLFMGTDDFASFLRLLNTDNNVNILSTPTLLAMDNSEASITVGGREPTVTKVSKDAATDQSIVNDIEYEETGIILDVVPHINSSGLVRLEVKQQITNVNDQQLATANLNTPRFTERIVETSLVAENGKTVIIGGIIQTQKTKIKRGVPGLGDVPLLGYLFSSTQDTTDKTELIIAITPHVVERGDDPVTEEFVRKLNRLRKRIQGATN